MNTGAIIESFYSTDNGGGVSVVSGGSFTLDGGTIQHNRGGSGGGVYVNGPSKFTMAGGTIAGNYADTNGGGVYVQSGRFEMSGGVIYGTGAALANTTAGNGASLSLGAGTAVYTGGSSGEIDIIPSPGKHSDATLEPPP